VLSNVFKTTINYSLFALRPCSGTEYDIHYSLCNVTTSGKLNRDFVRCFNDNSLGFAANDYKSTRDEVNYG